MTAALIYIVAVAATWIGIMAGEPTATPAFNEIFNWMHFLMACGIVGICSRLDDIKKEIGGTRK